MYKSQEPTQANSTRELTKVQSNLLKLKMGIKLGLDAQEQKELMEECSSETYETLRPLIEPKHQMLEQLNLQKLQHARFFLWWITVSNLMYAQAALRNPMNEKHFVVNCVYLSIAVFFLVILVLQLKFNFFLKFLWPYSVVLVIRQCIRLFDLEDTRFDPQDPLNKNRMTETEWSQLVQMQIASTFIIMLFQMSCFSNSRFVVPVVFFEILFGLFALMQSFELKIFFGQVVIIFMCHQHYTTSLEVTQRAAEVVSLKDQIESIFSDLDDASIIIFDHNIKMVNNSFLTLFEKEIAKA